MTTHPAEDLASDALSLIGLSRLVQAVFTRVAARHDLTPLQGRLLCVLAREPKGMADLARGFGVERAALTGLVDRAERRGLVERRPVPGDRRAVRVELTPAGRGTAGQFHAETTAELGRLLAPLAPVERAAFRAALAAITQSSEMPLADRWDRLRLGPGGDEAERADGRRDGAAGVDGPQADLTHGILRRQDDGAAPSA